MKTKHSILLAAALAGGLSITSANAASNSSVQFHEPENFTDFRTSSMGGTDEIQYLEREFSREIEKLATAHLPPGYQLRVVFHDIRMAGDFEPERGPDFNDVRIVKDIYFPTMTLAYEIVDAGNNVVARGEKKLSDMNFLSRLRIPTNEPLVHEFALLDDFVRKVSRSLS